MERAIELYAGIAPQVAMRGLRRVSVDRAWEFQVPGVLFIGLAALMGFLLFAA